MKNIGNNEIKEIEINKPNDIANNEIKEKLFLVMIIILRLANQMILITIRSMLMNSFNSIFKINIKFFSNSQNFQSMKEKLINKLIF